jgi:hypothetical protein
MIKKMTGLNTAALKKMDNMLLKAAKSLPQGIRVDRWKNTTVFYKIIGAPKIVIVMTLYIIAHEES